MEVVEGEVNQTLIQRNYLFNRLGVNTKRETHGQRVGVFTLLHVWAMEDSTRDFSSVEVMILAHLMTFGYWTHSQAEWRR